MGGGSVSVRPAPAVVVAGRRGRERVGTGAGQSHDAGSVALGTCAPTAHRARLAGACLCSCRVRDVCAARPLRRVSIVAGVLRRLCCHATCAAWTVAAFRAAGGTCVVASIVLYYSAHLHILVESPQRAAVPFGVGRVAGQLGKALGVRGVLGPLVSALGLVGLVIIARRLPRLRSIMLAWWVGTLLSLAPLLWTEQALRWTLFFFPAMALSGGVALDALAARGRIGRLVAYTLVVALVVWGAVLWYSQIVSYNH